MNGQDRAVPTWGKELALTWTNYLPPCRPSVNEMFIYDTYARMLKEAIEKKQIDILVLGSTPEFRDWGFQEQMNVTVMDYSIEYHDAITREMRHKNVNDKLVNRKWQDMDFEGDFDIVVGDLVIGNVVIDELASLVAAISRALRPGGYFMTKSFFWMDDYNPCLLPDIFAWYYNGSQVNHIFPEIAYDLTMCFTDPVTQILSFDKMYNAIDQLHKQGLVQDGHFDHFTSLGWGDNIKIGFSVPRENFWMACIQEHFEAVSIERGHDVYSDNIPVYVMEK